MKRRTFLQTAAMAAALVFGGCHSAFAGSPNFFKITTYLPGFAETIAIYQGGAQEGSLPAMAPTMGAPNTWLPPAQGTANNGPYSDGIVPIPIPAWDANNNFTPGTFNAEMTQQAAKSLGNLLGVVGYGSGGNTLWLYTNGVVAIGNQIAKSLSANGNTQGFANSYVYVMNLIASNGGARDDSNNWVEWLYQGDIALAAVAIGGPYAGLAAGGFMGMFGMMSDATGSTPASSYSAYDGGADWLFDDPIVDQFQGGGTLSFTNDWSRVLP